MSSAGNTNGGGSARDLSPMRLTAEQEHAIAELIGPRAAPAVRISPGLFEEDPVSLSLTDSDGERTFLISRDGGWTSAPANSTTHGEP